MLTFKEMMEELKNETTDTKRFNDLISYLLELPTELAEQQPNSL